MEILAQTITQPSSNKTLPWRNGMNFSSDMLPPDSNALVIRVGRKPSVYEHTDLTRGVGSGQFESQWQSKGVVEEENIQIIRSLPLNIDHHWTLLHVYDLALNFPCMR